MTNAQILRIAKEQSAIDLNCLPEDFDRTEPVIVPAAVSAQARKYLKQPFVCNMAYYGSNIVASVSGEFSAIAAAYLAKYPPEFCFEPPHLQVLQDAAAPLGYGAGMVSEYWLPDLNDLHALDCGYEIRILQHEDFAPYYTDEWSNALCKKRAELDVLGIGAYDGGNLIGLAGCSADCENMWQIGVDVLPGYRRKGIASALTSRLALEILKHEKVPFYCCAWSNLRSARNAIRSGFRPAWAELELTKLDDIAKMNGQNTERRPL